MVRHVVLRALIFLCGVCLSMWPSVPVWAHGFAGQRFFPEPIAMEDPFAADEMNLPSFSYIRTPEGRELSLGVELQKRLTDNLGVSIGGEYAMTNPLDPTQPNSRGFTSPEFAVKWVPYINGPHETVIGVQVSLGSTLGNHNVSEAHSSLGAQLAFGKGWGDLPQTLGWLRPLAMEGALGIEDPVGATTPDGTMLHTRLVVQYSLIYLQSFVKDVGIPWPFNRVFPQVEFSFDSQLSGVERGRTVTYAYPGFVWAGKYIEIGLEAQVPLMHNTGDNIGVIGMLHLFLDDMMPSLFHPLLQ